MGAFFASIAVKWWLRRILDWGGWLATLLLGAINLYNNLPPGLQSVVVRVIEGNWQEITLGSVPGILALIWSQIQSYRATVKPQIVTEDGQQADLKELPQAKSVAVQEYARTAIEKPKKSVLDHLIDKLNQSRR